jgi:hypothetical protein
MLTPELEIEVAARELRRVAYHEVAHKVICERFGGSGEVEVWRNDAESIKEGEAAWLGRLCIDVYPWIARQVQKAEGIRRVRVPVYSREYVCMAGMIAELILEDMDDQTEYDSESDANWFVADNLYTMIQDGYASESDLRGMGIGICEGGDIIGWRSGLVKTGIRMVREEWTKIVTKAETLISEALGNVETAEVA